MYTGAGAGHVIRYRQILDEMCATAAYVLLHNIT